MSHTGLSRHESYNNRFRTSDSSGNGSGGWCDDRSTISSPLPPPQSPSAAATTNRPHLHSVSENTDAYEDSLFSFGHLAFHERPSQPGQFHRMSSCEQPLSPLELSVPPSGFTGTGSSLVSPGPGHPHPHPHHHRYTPVRQNSGAGDTADPARPSAPGKPRRLSRQTSADTRRQQFAAASKASSGEGGDGRRIVTSADSAGCDDVFVDVSGRRAGEAAGGDGAAGSPTRGKTLLYDSSLFPSKKRQAEVTFSVASSASSTTNMVHNNPYNVLNHRVHDFVWCCSCLYFVFFCCLPAVHYMEQSDVEYNRNNSKRARTLGRLSTLFYVIGTFVTLTLFALLFFLAIFFTVN